MEKELKVKEKKNWWFDEDSHKALLEWSDARKKMTQRNNADYKTACTATRNWLRLC